MQKLDSISPELVHAKRLLEGITVTRRGCLKELAQQKDFVSWVREALQGVCCSPELGSWLCRGAGLCGDRRDGYKSCPRPAEGMPCPCPACSLLYAFTASAVGSYKHLVRVSVWNVL